MIETYQTRVSQNIAPEHIEIFSATLNQIAAICGQSAKKITRPKIMTPEQKFARWVRVSIASFPADVCLLCRRRYLIPLTPDSTVMRVVTPVSRASPGMCRRCTYNNSR